MMAGIKARDTKPEILVRKALFSAGFRFRLHRRDLPGCPDIVLVGRRIAIFVHGCFWHVHTSCKYAKTPETRREFWVSKLAANVERDQKNLERLQSDKWRTLVVWECVTRSSEDMKSLQVALIEWIKGCQPSGEIGAVSMRP
jgi:DNA mismatch endonuclease (patch repair protein)